MKCILHIGTEKTGTTSIQDFLQINNKNLIRQNISSLNRGHYIESNRLLVAAFQEKENNPYFDIHKITEPTSYIKKYKEDFKYNVRTNHQASNIMIISSEHFHSLLTKREEINNLKVFLETIFEEIKIICYFREQSQVQLSRYSTSLRVGHNYDLNKYFSSINNNAHYFNYKVFFSKWHDNFGKNNLIPRIFSKSHFQDEYLLKDFITQCSNEIDFKSLIKDKRSSNSKFNLKQIAALKALNSLTKKNKINLKNKKILNKLIMNQDFGIDSGYLLHPRSSQIYEICNEQNIIFFKEFFGSEENLFKELHINESDAQDRIDIIQKEFEPTFFEYFNLILSKKILDINKHSASKIINNDKIEYKLINYLHHDAGE